MIGRSSSGSTMQLRHSARDLPTAAGRSSCESLPQLWYANSAGALTQMQADPHINRPRPTGSRQTARHRRSHQHRHAHRHMKRAPQPLLPEVLVFLERQQKLIVPLGICSLEPAPTVLDGIKARRHTCLHTYMLHSWPNMLLSRLRILDHEEAWDVSTNMCSIGMCNDKCIDRRLQ